MEIINKIEIENFRSIKSATLDTCGDFSILAGTNNSGKSNFLRALNAFFTGFTEPGIKITIDKDYYKPGLRARKKKIIRVSVVFNLPENFNFRRELADVRTLLSARSFIITKKWDRDSEIPKILLNNSQTPLSHEDTRKIEQFLSLISFRYIPNRVLPLDIIKNEHQALRDVLVRRLGRSINAEDMFKKISDKSSSLIYLEFQNFTSFSSLAII